MPVHARPRPELLGRWSTLLVMAVTVASLASLAVVHFPVAASAEGVQTPPTAQVDGKAVGREEPVGPMVQADLEPLVRAQRRAERLERERRAEARAAARAERRSPQWVLPVPGAGWSASFGEAGSMWSSGYHTGQDFTAPTGTPVMAAGPGTITSASWSDAYGNVLVITHPGGAQSWYAHMSGFKRTSGPVAAGDVIGYVGCTGNCYGSHLHFEYRPGGGEPADPLPWLRSNGAY
jgi:murein DD-endopeptidase MepM/ murein hydrolase activator NlpD